MVQGSRATVSSTAADSRGSRSALACWGRSRLTRASSGLPAAAPSPSPPPAGVLAARGLIRVGGGPACLVAPPPAPPPVEPSSSAHDAHGRRTVVRRPRWSRPGRPGCLAPLGGIPRFSSFYFL